MAERNDVPVQQWLEVWENLEQAGRYIDYQNQINAINALGRALSGLYLLWEPPSVREIRRADDAVLEFVEGDE